MSLEIERIGKNANLLIDPDNVFWGLAFGEDIGNGAHKSLLHLYSRFKQRLDASMRDFRFKTNLNSAYINPTDRCNASCPYCYIPASMRKNGRHINDSQLRYILKKLDSYFDGYRSSHHAKPVIIYHGSEPLLMKEMLFDSIVKFNKKFHFGIQTNAILLEPDDVKFLKSHKVSVGISLDSLDPAVNNRTRRVSSGSTNYDKAIRAIEMFNGYEGLNVITTITRHNVRTLPEMVRFAHSKRVPCLLLNPVRATRRSTLRLRPAHKDLTKYFIKALKIAMELSKRSKHQIIIGNFSNIILGIVAPQARRLMCDISPCGGGRCFFAITANGDMVPCGEFIPLKEFRGGNIFNTSIKKAISSEPFKKVRARVVEGIEECDICIYRNICGAPCPAEVYSLTKDINTKSPYCEFYKEIIKYAFKLISEDKIKYFLRKEALGNVKYEYKLGAKE